jgi:hypothetical protein
MPIDNEGPASPDLITMVMQEVTGGEPYVLLIYTAVGTAMLVDMRVGGIEGKDRVATLLATTAAELDADAAVEAVSSLIGKKIEAG